MRINLIYSLIGQEVTGYAINMERDIDAVAFSKRWKDAHNEEAQSQTFVFNFLHVFGVDDPEATGDFELRC